jgi:hypothetical protein
LSGTVLVEPDTTFEIERSVSHGGLAAVHAMATKLGVKKLLGPECRERDLAYGLILSRVLQPTSKLSTLGWWNDTTLGTDLGIARRVPMRCMPRWTGSVRAKTSSRRPWPVGI